MNPKPSLNSGLASLCLAENHILKLTSPDLTLTDKVESYKLRRKVTNDYITKL